MPQVLLKAVNMATGLFCLTTHVVSSVVDISSQGGWGQLTEHCCVSVLL